LTFPSANNWQGQLQTPQSESTSQGISSILCKPNIQYRIHKSPLTVLIVSRINPVHAPSHPIETLLYGKYSTDDYVGHPWHMHGKHKRKRPEPRWVRIPLCHGSTKISIDFCADKGFKLGRFSV